MLSTGARLILNLPHSYCTRELFLYLLFGGLAALASLFAGWVLYEEALFPGLPYWGATTAAATIGLFVNFILNYFFNFKFRERTAFQQFGTFCVVSGFGIILTSFLSEIFFIILKSDIGDSINLGYATLPAKFVANFVAVGFVVLYSFPAHRLVSFNIGIGARLRQLGNRPMVAVWRCGVSESVETCNRFTPGNDGHAA